MTGAAAGSADGRRTRPRERGRMLETNTTKSNPVGWSWAGGTYCGGMSSAAISEDGMRCRS
ncbi:MAG: hypothetical protein GEV07_21890 [Streptosporangiales bacterium]|nr:hypothetical protein [Streptosporangiales bacterium]